MKRFHRNYYASKFCLDFSPVKTTWRAQQWLPPFYFQNDKWDYFLRRHFVTFCYNNFVDKNDVVNVWCYIFVMLLKIPQFEEDNKLNFFPNFKEKKIVWKNSYVKNFELWSFLTTNWPLCIANLHHLTNLWYYIFYGSKK